MKDHRHLQTYWMVEHVCLNAPHFHVFSSLQDHASSLEGLDAIIINLSLPSYL